MFTNPKRKQVLEAAVQLYETNGHEPLPHDSGSVWNSTSALAYSLTCAHCEATAHVDTKTLVISGTAYRRTCAGPGLIRHNIRRLHASNHSRRPA